MNMYPNLPENYTIADASVEILVMLFVSFLLGFILAWFIRNVDDSQENQTLSHVPPATKKKDNLKLIEGVGPKIEELLHTAHIFSFEDICTTDISHLEKILSEAGPSYQMHTPKTWPDQARLAADGKWAELKEYQDILVAGRTS